MSRMFSGPCITLSVCLLALAPTSESAPATQSNNPAPMVDVETVGPKVGDVLPDFTLRDQSGEMRSMRSLLGPNGAVIVFFRSADW